MISGTKLSANTVLDTKHKASLSTEHDFCKAPVMRSFFLLRQTCQYIL